METPKTQAEFNAMYAQLCAEIGDKMIAIQNLTAQIDQIKVRISELAKEAKEAAQASAPTA